MKWGFDRKTSQSCIAKPKLGWFSDISAYIYIFNTWNRKKKEHRHCINIGVLWCVCTHIMIQVTIVSQTDSEGAILHPWTPTRTPPWEWSSSINPGPRPNRLYPNLCLIACWTQIWSFGCLLKIDFRASYSASLESKSFCRYNKSLPCEAFQSCQCLLAVSFSPYAVPLSTDLCRRSISFMDINSHFYFASKPAS